MTAQERFEQTFVVGDKARLLVANVRGNIEVKRGAAGEIHVTAVKHVKDCKRPEETVVEIYQDGDRVIARVRPPERKRWRSIRVCPVDFTVHVPAQCDVKSNQVTGRVHVSGVAGQVDLNVVHGEVELYDIDGRTRVKSVSAGVSGQRWQGRAHINTVSGQVQLTSSQLQRIRASTVSADVSIETHIDDHGRYDFNSVSGDVTLYLAPGRGVESRGHSISGRLVCDLPHQFSQHRPGGWHATINDGGPLVSFHSISGDLEVLAASPLAA